MTNIDRSCCFVLAKEELYPGSLFRMSDALLREYRRQLPGCTYLCASCQQVFRHIDRPMRVMAAALRSGGEAGAVMDWYRRGDKRSAPR